MKNKEKVRNCSFILSVISQDKINPIHGTCLQFSKRYIYSCEYVLWLTLLLAQRREEGFFHF